MTKAFLFDFILILKYYKIRVEIGGVSMSNIYNKAHELVNEIKRSEEYRKYISLKNRVNENEANREMIETFKKETIEIQMIQMSGEDIDPERLQRIKELEKIIMLDSTLKDFMFAEIKLSQIIQDISRIVLEGIDLD